MTTVDIPAQVVHPDGRVDLGETPPQQGDYVNPELTPVPVSKRSWSTYNFAALWMGMAHNIPSYLLASGLIALGMDWLQAFLTITLGNLIVLVPMLLNSHAGTKYGIPFPVFARAFYGVRGANLAALLRAFIACGWFGIQTWVGGEAVYVIVGKLVGSGWINAAPIGGKPWTVWLSFALFWLLQMAIIWRGIDAIRRFENWAAPLVTIAFAALLVWVLIQAGGFGPILSQPSKLGWGPGFWLIFPPALMGMIAFWATLSLNMPDFTRFGASQRKQLIGQVLGLPTTMSFISIVSIIVTSGSVVIYGKALWDPVELASNFSNPVVVILGLVVAVLATVSANVAANVVSPSYDFSNAMPKWVNFRTGGMLTGVIGILIQPWRLLADPHIYIFGWLGLYGGVLAAVAGVLVAGYWVRDKTVLALPELYRRDGRYWFFHGWNLNAIIATVIGAVLAVGGVYSNPGQGPFPAGGLIPFLKPLYDYSWAVGLIVAFLVYLLLSMSRLSQQRPVPAVAAVDS